jgi:hypothetical protein
MQQENVMSIKEENVYHVANLEYQEYALNGELNSSQHNMAVNNNNNKSVLKQMLTNDGLKQRATQISNHQSPMYANYNAPASNGVLYTMSHQPVKEKPFASSSSSSTCTSVSSSSSSSLSPINKHNTPVDYAFAGQHQQHQHQPPMSNVIEHHLLQAPFQSQPMSYLQSNSMDPILNKYASDSLINMNDDDVDVINQLEQVINLTTNHNDTHTTTNYSSGVHNSYDSISQQATAPQMAKLANQGSMGIYSNDSFGQTYPPSTYNNFNVNDAQRMNVNIPFNI